MAAEYPTTITEQLYEVVSRLATTLTADINDLVTTIPVASTAGFPAKGFVVIGNETIYYGSLGVNSLTTCTRGFSGTAAAHLQDSQVKAAIVAAHLNRVREELIATQTKIGISGSTVTTTVEYKLRNIPAQGSTAQVTNLNANYLGGKTVIDEDNMASNLDTAVPTQQSVKAYVSGLDDANVKLTGNQTISGIKTLDDGCIVHSPETYTPAGAGTATLDLSKGNRHRITMPAGNITIAISNATVGQAFTAEITQDGGGSRTVTWFTTIRWADGSAPTLTTTADKRDTFGFIVTGAGTFDGFVIGQNI